MNRRIAKKIHSRHMGAIQRHERIRRYNLEVGPDGDALRDALSRMFKFEPQQSPYASGWWPRGKLMHHLQVHKGKVQHKVSQLKGAYPKLSLDHQLEWWLAETLYRKSRARDELVGENPWELAEQSLEAVAPVVAAMLKHAASTSA